MGWPKLKNACARVWQAAREAELCFWAPPIAIRRVPSVLSEWCGVHRGFPPLHQTMSVTQPTVVALTDLVLNQGEAARASVWPRGILRGSNPGYEDHIYPLPLCV